MVKHQLVTVGYNYTYVTGFVKMCIVRTKQNIKKIGKQKITFLKTITLMHHCIHISLARVVARFHFASMFTV